jgi:hypothetical protein
MAGTRVPQTRLDRQRASHVVAITAGGASGDLREVYFYREQLKGHTERQYRP